MFGPEEVNECKDMHAQVKLEPNFGEGGQTKKYASQGFSSLYIINRLIY